MFEKEKASLLSFLRERDYSDKELKTISDNFLGLVSSSAYSLSTQAKIISLTRKEIKDTLGLDSPILEHLKIPNDILIHLDQEKEKRLQKKLKNKILISYPDYISIIKALMSSPSEILNFIGFGLATGRRFSECSSDNFTLTGKNSLSFSGQLKTREGGVYEIPTLYSARRLLSSLKTIEKSLDLKVEGSDYQKIWRMCIQIFGESFHKLRAKYCVLTLKKEGYLESDSTIDPIIRAKELLGHAWESDATIAYQSYSVTKKSLPETEKILNRIAGINAKEKIDLDDLPNEDESNLRPKELLEKILTEKPYLFDLSKREASTILRKEYEKRRGGKRIDSKVLINFLFDVGIVEDLSKILTPDEDKLLKKISNSKFSEYDRVAIIRLYRTFNPTKTRRHCTLDFAQGLLGESFTSKDLAKLKALFKKYG